MDAVPHSLINLTAEAAERLRQLIEQSGMTPERVARAAGCSPVFLEELLDGRRFWIHPDILRYLARVLHTYPAAILTGSLDPAANLGSRIAQLRRDRGLSQKKLAELLEGLNGVGIHPGHIRRLERGQVRRPREENLATLARALGVSADYLLHGTDEPAAPPDAGTTLPGTSPGPRRRLPRLRMAVSVSMIALAAVLVMARVARGPTHGEVDAMSMEIRLANAGHTIEAVEGPTQRLRWKVAFGGRVERYETVSWNGQRVVLVGLDHQTTRGEAGGFFVYRLADGERIVADPVDSYGPRDAIRCMGAPGGEIAFRWKRYALPGAPLIADVDGDHQKELLIASSHTVQNMPSRLRVYDADGMVRGTFYVTGALNYHIAGDFDDDGEDEILLSCTCGPEKAGFSLLLLDRDHLDGVSPDAARDPDCQMTLSALRAVSLPPFDPEYMRLLGSNRLMAWDALFLHPDATAGVAFMVSIGTDPDYPALLYLDRDLKPLRLTYSDTLRRSLDSVPAEVRDRFLNEYLGEWVETAGFFPVHAVATSSSEYRDVPQH